MIESGEIYEGQKAQIIDQTGKTITVLVAGIESCQKIINYAKQGDSVGLLLAKVPEECVVVGSWITIESKDAFVIVQGVLKEYNGSEKNVSIPGCVEEIAPMAFARKPMKRIILPHGLKKIGHHAFAECCALEQITIPGTVEKLEEGLFVGCGQLKQVVLENGVKEIGNAVFFDCAELDSITIPDSVTYIGEMAFQGAKLKKLFLPDSVKRIGDSACINCTSLEEVHLSDSLTFIPDNMFERCVSLKSIDIPNDVDDIGVGAFLNCTTLESIRLPEVMLSIEKGAFHGCSMLKTVTLDGSQDDREAITIEPMNLELEKANWIILRPEADEKPEDPAENPSAQEEASEQFSEKKDDNVLTFPPISDSIALDGERMPVRHMLDVESYMNGVSVRLKPPYKNTKHYYIGDVLRIPEKIQGKPVLKIERMICDSWSEEVDDYIPRDPFLASIDNTYDGYHKSGSHIESGTITYRLEKVIVPQGVEIDSGAFPSNTTVFENVPPKGEKQNDAKKIPEHYRKQLEHYRKQNGINIYCPGCNAVVNTQDTFCANCGKSLKTPQQSFLIEDGVLKKFYGRETQVVVPDGVKIIGENAFRGCNNMKTITIPNSVKKISDHAFHGCDCLDKFFFIGTKKQAEKIDYGQDNDYLLNAEWIYSGEKSQKTPAKQQSKDVKKSNNSKPKKIFQVIKNIASLILTLVLPILMIAFVYGLGAAGGFGAILGFVLFIVLLVAVIAVVKKLVEKYKERKSSEDALPKT